MAGSRVELFERIRWDHQREGLSIRALASRHRVRRGTVRQALACAVPPPRKTPVRRAPKLDRAKPLIDAMLREDLDAPRKQRHTARRVLARLVDEHGLTELTYSSVRDYVARCRAEVLAEVGRSAEQAFVPQVHPPGAEAEVDFADLWVQLDGVLTRCFLFTLRLSYSGKAVHRVFASQGQEAFIEGHLEAFAVLGGVPFDKIRYDNLKSAVSRVLFGRNRLESDQWVAFRSHYGFDAFYCQPGVDGAHEKGGVEGEGGRFRRTHLVPVPTVATLAELNCYLAECDRKDDTRRVANRSATVGMDFAAEAPLLRPLPVEPFEVGLSLTPRVDRYARIMVRQCHYSVPVRFIGRRVRARLGASELVVSDGRTEIARHSRSVRKGSQTLVLDHYLEVLTRKPGALPGSVALAQARADGHFTSAHDAFWAAARKRHGDADGTRALVEVLLLHRHLAHADVVAGLTAAVSVGATGADVVAVEARKAAQARGAAGQVPKPPAPRRAERVASLTERRLRELPPDGRPLPTVRSRASELVDAAEREQLTYRGFLAELLLAECDERERRRSARRVKAAGFPRDKWLADFDFDANPAVNPATIHALASCTWVRAGDPLCLIGDSGTGKTHLLIALGTAAAQQGYRVRYTLATKLVNELVEAADERQLAKTIARYGRVDLLCIDELGYMELDRRGAELLFQVLTEREENASVAIASNESFSGWTKTFTDPRLCAAIVDRLTFAGNIIETGTDSYRLAHARTQRATAG